MGGTYEDNMVYIYDQYRGVIHLWQWPVVSFPLRNVFFDFLPPNPSHELISFDCCDGCFPPP